MATEAAAGHIVCRTRRSFGPKNSLLLQNIIMMPVDFHQVAATMAGVPMINGCARFPASLVCTPVHFPAPMGSKMPVFEPTLPFVWTGVPARGGTVAQVCRAFGASLQKGRRPAPGICCTGRTVAPACKVSVGLRHREAERGEKLADLRRESAVQGVQWHWPAGFQQTCAENSADLRYG